MTVKAADGTWRVSAPGSRGVVLGDEAGQLDVARDTGFQETKIKVPLTG